jgi:hypothetical protein
MFSDRWSKKSGIAGDAIFSAQGCSCGMTIYLMMGDRSEQNGRRQSGYFLFMQIA